MASEKPAGGGPYLSLAACIAIVSVAPLSGLAQSALGPILPQITEHFADVPSAGVLVRLMLSGLSFAMIVGALASGFLAERVGELRLMLICLVIYGIAGAAGYLLDELHLLVASRIVLGVVMSILSGLGMALITTDIAPAKRDRWIGFYVVIGTVATVLLMGVVGIIASNDWRNVFLLYLAGFPIALFMALTYPPRDKAARAAAVAAATSGRGVPWQKMTMSALIGAAGTGMFMYLPYHLAAIGEGRPEQLAPVMMASTAVSSVFSALYGWVRQRLGTVSIFAGGLLLAAAGVLVIATTGERAMVFGGIALFGAGFGIVVPHMFAACAAATPAPYRPRMLGFLRSTYYGGPLLAQVGLEVVTGRLGPTAAVAAIALICVAGALAALAFRKTFVPVEEAAAIAGSPARS